MFNNESETQKNWNEFFQNEKPSKNYTPNIILILILLICFIYIAVYYRNNQPNEEPLDNTINNTKVKVIVNDSNKNGSIMVESIETINDILNNKTIGSTKEELQNHITTIENTKLSAEYYTFKNRMIEKINYYIDFLDSNSEEDLIKFNSIDFTTELALAFDEAGVKYEILEDGKIYYWYKK